MSRVNDLITELAPKGVQFKALGEVGEFIRGKGLQKSDLTSEGAPAIHYGQIHTYYGIWADATKSFTDPGLAARLRRAKPGDLIIATTSEDDAAVAKATAWIGEGEVAVSSDAYIYRHTADPRYMAFFFQSEQFQRQKMRHITGTKVRRVSGDALAKIRIPLPPLEVQREIVRVLDLFTLLKAELEAERDARRRQYGYYLDRLLTFREEDAEWTTLGEVGRFVRGRRFTKDEYVESGFGCIHYGQIYTDYGTSATSTITFLDPVRKASLRLAHKGDLVIAATGENVEEVCKAVAWLGDEGIAVHDDCQIFHHTLNPKFASYFFQSTAFNQQKAKFVSESKVVRVSGANLAKIKLHVPPLKEQERVVALLDSLDTLITDRTVGMPAELAARRKQYEYYRDHLLTFKEIAA